MAADIGGTSDPFVQLIVRNRGTLKQTSTMRKTISPIWNEEFELYSYNMSFFHPRILSDLILIRFLLF